MERMSSIALVQREQVQGFLMPNLKQLPPGFNLKSSTDFPGLPARRVEIVENPRVSQDSLERLRVTVERLNQSV